MKKFAFLATASALHLVNNRAPHEELLQTGTRVAQFYGIDPAAYITQGYSWQVVGNVKLEQIASTFMNTASAAMNIWAAIQTWMSTLQSNWDNTLDNVNESMMSAMNSTNSSSKFLCKI